MSEPKVTRPKRKSYDDKFRASAVVMLEAAGYPTEKGALLRTSEHLGVPSMTLMRWFRKDQNPPPNELVTEKRGELKDFVKSELNAIFGDMPLVRADASYRDLATAAGILIDKLQLLENKPTERVEHSGNLSIEQRASRINEILGAARDRRTRDADERVH